MKLTSQIILGFTSYILTVKANATTPVVTPAATADNEILKLVDSAKKISSEISSLKSVPLAKLADNDIQNYEAKAHEAIYKFVKVFDPLFNDYFGITTETKDIKETIIKKFKEEKGLENFSEKIVSISKDSEDNITAIENIVINALKDEDEKFPLKVFLLDKAKFPNSNQYFTKITNKTANAEDEFKKNGTPHFIHEIINLNAKGVEELKALKTSDSELIFYVGTTLVLFIACCVMSAKLLKDKTQVTKV